MIKIGDFNNLKVLRKTAIGYYLDGTSDDRKDDILLPFGNAMDRDLELDSEVEAFIYRDSQDRLVATLKAPLAKIGDIAYLKVVDYTDIGCFVDFGLEKHILVPFKEIAYKIEEGESYLFYIYLDKTKRLAATTHIDEYLHHTNTYEINDEATCTVYGIQTNGSLMVAIDNLYRGVILKNEYYTEISPGTIIKVRITKYYEDGKMGVTPRKTRLEEMEDVEAEIVRYLDKHEGSMSYNDKSNSQDIKKEFGCSKNAFKRALGGLMKNHIISQDENGTKLIEGK